MFEPLEPLERLAALTPRPRINLVLYYGVLGARAARRPSRRDAGATGTRRGAAVRDTTGAAAAHELFCGRS